MLEVFDRNRQRTAVLETAYNVQEVQKLNGIGYLTFTLPYDAVKNAYCQPFCFVRHDGGEMYRIMTRTAAADDSGSVTYECEHVLAVLLDNVLYGYHVIGGTGVNTAEVVRYILARQTVVNWVLATCDFSYHFEYGFEGENLLSALFAVFAPFVEPCRLVTDTSIYPWRLSLRRLQATGGHPAHYIRYRHNMIRFQQSRNPQQICTRIYPLGCGEGINQLTIRDANGGIPYLQSPPEIVARYGLIDKVWIDRRYGNAESLKAAAAALLRQLQQPEASYQIEHIENASPGDLVRIYFPDRDASVDTYITEITRDFNDISKSVITISNRAATICAQLAEQADKMRIAETYAQGATQVYVQALQANCDFNNAATMDFLIPQEMRIINKVIAKIRVQPFRAYSKATETTEIKARTSYTKSVTLKTSESGHYDAEIETGTEGFASDYKKYMIVSNRLEPNDSGGFDNIDLPAPMLLVYTEKPTVTEWATGTIGMTGVEYAKSHYHAMEFPDHVHNFILRDHAHNYTVPQHNHTVEVRAHEHDIEPGIYKFGNPQAFSVFIDSVKKQTVAGVTAELDITNYLLGSDGKIPRDKWLSFSVLPDDLAYTSIVLVVQGFVQSRGEVNA